jgi:NAD(P)-dependent dehydrogenase (short-subunit alcohol dehydrogenase family)
MPLAGQLSGKVAIITGGAAGIGCATASIFAREGATVIVADVNQEAGPRVVEQIARTGGSALFEAVDVTLAEDCHRLVESTIRELGRIDILFNNAGIIRRATVLELSEENWDRVMAVNVKSIYLLSREVIPHMEKQDAGCIINTASGWGLAAGPKAAVYCASKAAVVLLTKAMAIDHGPRIRVNCICPGDTDTGMLRAEAAQLGEEADRFLIGARKRPLGRVGSPDEIAQAVLYLASDASSFVTGTALVVDGGGLAGSI